MDKLQLTAAMAAAIGACFAAIVALIPIYQSSSEKKAKARNLRMRIASKLVMLRPTLASLSENVDSDKDLVLTPEEVKELLLQLESLLQESACLHPIEQDRVSAFVTNLELMIPFYKNNKLSSQGADNMILLADRVRTELEEHGFLATDPHQPWHEDSNA